jgi:hypothetical protein
MAETAKSPAHTYGLMPGFSRNLPEVVGRVHASALMGPTNIGAFVVLELRADGSMTWRDA